VAPAPRRRGGSRRRHAARRRSAARRRRAALTRGTLTGDGRCHHGADDRGAADTAGGGDRCGVKGSCAMTAVALHHHADGPRGAPVVVLGSSLGTAAEMWRPQLPALAARLRVIRYDHRGHGGSPVDDRPCEIADLGRDVLALLDRLGIERASFGGFSLGGMVAIWLGANASDRVDRLVLCCTAAHMPPASAWAERAAAVRAAGTTEVVADAVVARWLTPGFAERRPDLVEWLRGMLVATPAAGYAACCGAIERMDMRADLERIAAPTLVVSAAEDPATPPEHQRRLAAGIRGARLEPIAGAAHLAGVERTEQVNRLMLEHLEQAAA